MRVKEIMSSKDIACCSLGTNLAAAAEMLWIHDCGMLPVLDDIGRVVGVLTDRDLCIALGTRDRKASEVSVGEVMPRRLFDCDPEVDVLSALKVMAAEQVRRLPVVDATGTIPWSVVDPRCGPACRPTPRRHTIPGSDRSATADLRAARRAEACTGMGARARDENPGRAPSGARGR
jgi:CBS domain-containing protein